MKSQPRDEIDDLIDRHLDGVLDVDGRSRLEEALQASPEAALRFARAARMDERLFRHFNRRQAMDGLRIPADAAPTKVIRPAWIRSLGDHAWGPVAAVALHAALLAILIRWVILPPAPGPDEGIEITLANPPERTPLDRRPVLPDDPGGLAPPIPGPSIARPPPAEIEPPGVADLRVAFLPLDAGVASSVADPARLAHPLVAGRFGAERRRRTALYGGTWSAAADGVVSNAVAWLAARQSPDGAWREPGTDDDALTSLVLLALMGRGETPVHGDHRGAVRAALQRLAAVRPGTHAPRSTALRLCALADSVALTRLPALQTMLGEAASASLDAERPDGGWDNSGPAADPLATAWTVEALRVAATAGVDDPRLAPALHRAAAALDAATIPTSGLLYYPSPARHGPLAFADTAASLLALQLAGDDSGTRMQRGLRTLDSMPAAWPVGDAPPSSIEALYFATRARFNEGGGGWMKWMASLAPAMVQAASPGGFWPGETEARDVHPIRTTALAVLILETPSRYPPSGRWPVTAKASPGSIQPALAGLHRPGAPSL